MGEIYNNIKWTSQDSNEQNVKMDWRIEKIPTKKKKNGEDPFTSIKYYIYI